jgi:hypothetical protein
MDHGNDGSLPDSTGAGWIFLDKVALGRRDVSSGLRPRCTCKSMCRADQLRTSPLIQELYLEHRTAPAASSYSVCSMCVFAVTNFVEAIGCGYAVATGMHGLIQTYAAKQRRTTCG